MYLIASPQEALIRSDLDRNLQIDYDIVYSPTYQVPVLYFILRWNNYQGPIGLNEVYQYVVPEQYKKELKSVGIMGGISFGVSGPPKRKKEISLTLDACLRAHAS